MSIENLETKNSVQQNLDTVTIEQVINDNPDLSYEFVRNLLTAKAEVDAGMVEPYEFG